MKPIVYIVDDDAAVRDGIATLLDSVGLEARSCASARDFFAEYEPTRPGCLVLDICMPGIGGLELQEQLVARAVTLPVIIVTGHGNVQAAVRSMKLGAVDFIEKPFPRNLLLERIRAALDLDTDQRGSNARQEETLRRIAQLSPRELEVVNILITGRSNKEIARQLGISPRTVEVYRAKVMLKLQVDSLCNLVRLMLQAEERPVPTLASGRRNEAGMIAQLPGPDQAAGVASEM